MDFQTKAAVVGAMVILGGGGAADSGDMERVFDSSGTGAEPELYSLNCVTVAEINWTAGSNGVNEDLGCVWELSHGGRWESDGVGVRRRGRSIKTKQPPENGYEKKMTWSLYQWSSTSSTSESDKEEGFRSEGGLPMAGTFFGSPCSSSKWEEQAETGSELPWPPVYG